jgi:hypothetical protein
MNILNILLQNYNDGRQKDFFCIAVNLLEINDIKSILEQIEHETKTKDITIKEKSIIVINLFNKMAEKRGIKLELIEK